MGETAHSKLSAKEAIEVAFGYFDDFFDANPENIHHKLLESVEFDPEKEIWDITIGFNVGRAVREATPKNAQLAGILGSLSTEKEYAREFRTVTVSAVDGAFVRMRSG